MSNPASAVKPATPGQDFATERLSPLDQLASGGAGRPSTPEAAAPARNLDMVMRIPVSVKVVLGSATMPVANLVALGRGAVIPLDRRVGEPVDVVVNGRIVARGEVVVMDEDGSRFGVSLTEVVEPAGSYKPS
ncbi:MAG TPA: flagellar motor switch protein FliN [Hyphomicrobiaceae bacterium]|nr:flagellar motor switch protein FliN [Hyphomicrobiaceae bacterium]